MVEDFKKDNDVNIFCKYGKSFWMPNANTAINDNELLDLFIYIVNKEKLLL